MQPAMWKVKKRYVPAVVPSVLILIGSMTAAVVQHSKAVIVWSGSFLGYISAMCSLNTARVTSVDTVCIATSPAIYCASLTTSASYGWLF